MKTFTPIAQVTPSWGSYDGYSYEDPFGKRHLYPDPVPEPAAYGLISTGSILLFLFMRKFLKRKS